MAEHGSFNHFPQMIEALHAGAVVGVRKACQHVAEEASLNTPVDTGFLLGSEYWVTSDFSNYNQAITRAAKNGDEFTAVLPEMEHPSDDLEGHVGYAASYAIYVHDGARGLSARPWLATAANGANIAPIIADEIRRAVGKVREGGE